MTSTETGCCQHISFTQESHSVSSGPDLGTGLAEVNETHPRPHRLSREVKCSGLKGWSKCFLRFFTFAAETCHVLSYHQKALLSPFSLQKDVALFILQRDRLTFELGSPGAGWHRGRETGHMRVVWALCGKRGVT